MKKYPLTTIGWFFGSPVRCVGHQRQQQQQQQQQQQHEQQEQGGQNFPLGSFP